MTTVDVLVVGAGPAGLTAATYLARFHRSVIVADAGDPRAAWIPLSHNMPGFPAGITGDAILSRMREQALEYNAVIQPGRAENLTIEPDCLRAQVGEQTITARAVLLATGVVDHHPDLPGVERAVERALVRICPICDGYEATGKTVAVIGHSDLGAREAAFLRTYTDRLTLIHVGPPDALTERAALAELGIDVIETPIETVRIENDRVTAQSWSMRWNGQDRAFDLVYSALGTSPNAELAQALGARLAEDGRLEVDLHQRTSVPGLWAAGDVVRGLNQIAVATAEAAVAATDIHNALRRADGLTL